MSNPRMLSKLLVGSALTGAMVFTGASAQAAAPTQDQSAASHASSQAAYSDSDVVALVLFAKGPIADENPTLAKKIQGQRPKAKISMNSIDDFTAELKNIDPQFHERVALAVQQGDPYKAQDGLKRLNRDISEWLKAKNVNPKTDGKMKANGWVWHDSYIATEQNIAAVWQVAAGTTVAAGAEAVVVVAIVPAAASYQFEMNKTGAIDKQELIASVTSAFH